jgi:GTP-binding protein EngB required for normal cell division
LLDNLPEDRKFRDIIQGNEEERLNKLEIYRDDREAFQKLSQDGRQTNLDLHKKLKFAPIIVVGPSGVGKSTLIAHLKEKYPEAFGFSISYTTRAARPGEIHGVNYFYISKAEFK